MRRLIDAEELLKAIDSHDKFGYSARYGLERLDKDDKGFVPYVKYEEIEKAVINASTITEQKVAKPLFTEFKEKLSKWMYHNSESVCGDSMIDIYYLEGHIDEILYEMGVIGEVEDGSN